MVLMKEFRFRDVVDSGEQYQLTRICDRKELENQSGGSSVRLALLHNSSDHTQKEQDDVKLSDLFAYGPSKRAYE